MSTWISRPEDVLGRQWHLEETEAETRAGFALCACGLTFVESTTSPIDRRDEANGVPESEWCPGCKALHSQRLALLRQG